MTATGETVDYCRTGTPCLVVEGRPTTVEEFARRAMLPALFPDLVAVDRRYRAAQALGIGGMSAEVP